MWYSYGPSQGLTEAQIDADITKALQAQLQGDGFDFVWYENPKMTVPDLHHVQVFWHKLNCKLAATPGAGGGLCACML